MPTVSKLLFPPKGLASFIAAAIFRDTRGVELNDTQRLNYFPATPLFSVTIVLDGQLHIGSGSPGLDDLMTAPAVSGVFVFAPSDTPTVSWSPGAVAALTLAIYPDAWRKTSPGQKQRDTPAALHDASRHLTLDKEIELAFQSFCAQLDPFWQAKRRTEWFPDWEGSDRIADWARGMLASSAMSRPAQTARSMQRHLKRWTGRSRQSLEFYARLESLHEMRQAAPQEDLARTAIEAGYSDQSHMGRSLKRATGFSPAALNQRIATDEAFWCYRLLSERF